MTSSASRRPSTADTARSSAGRHPPRPSTSTYDCCTATVLQWPVKPRQIHEYPVRPTRAATRRAAFGRPQGPVLGQRRGRVLLRHYQDRTARPASLAHPQPRRSGHLRVDGGQVHHPPSTLHRTSSARPPTRPPRTPTEPIDARGSRRRRGRPGGRRTGSSRSRLKEITRVRCLTDPAGHSDDDGRAERRRPPHGNQSRRPAVHSGPPGVCGQFHHW